MKWGLAPGAVGEDQPGGRRPGSGPESSLISSVTKQVSFHLWVLVSHLENRMLSQELLRTHPALTVHGSVVCPAKKHFPGPHPRSLVGVAGAHLPSRRIRRQCVTPPVRVHVSWVQLCKVRGASVGASDDREEASRGLGLEGIRGLGLGEKSGTQVPQMGNGWGGRRRVSRADSPGQEWRV